MMEQGDTTPETSYEARYLLDDAIVAFQTAGYADYLVRGLLKRAQFYASRRDADDYSAALADLEKAAFESQRGQMNLLYVDALLLTIHTKLAFLPVMTRPEREGILVSMPADLGAAASRIELLRYGRRKQMISRLQELSGKFMNSNS